MDPDERFAKRVSGAALLRAVPPQRSLEMAFELIRVTRELNTAASSAAAEDKARPGASVKHATS